MKAEITKEGFIRISAETVAEKHAIDSVIHHHQHHSFEIVTSFIDKEDKCKECGGKGIIYSTERSGSMVSCHYCG